MPLCSTPCTCSRSRCCRRGWSGGPSPPGATAATSRRSSSAASRVPNPDRKPVAWFHGVSVGEVNLLGTLVPAFRKRHPDWLVVVSSTTDTGLAEARKRFAGPGGDRVAVRLLLGGRGGARRGEARRWSCSPRASCGRTSSPPRARRGVPVVVVNARMSPRSFARLRRLSRGWPGGCCSATSTRFAVQAQDYADRLRQLGVPAAKLTVTGSVKYDGATGERDTPKARELRRLLGVKSTLAQPPGGSGSAVAGLGRRQHARPGRGDRPRRVRPARGSGSRTCGWSSSRATRTASRRSPGSSSSPGLPFVRRSQITEPLAGDAGGRAARHGRRTRGGVGAGGRRLHRRQPRRPARRAEHDRAGRLRRADACSARTCGTSATPRSGWSRSAGR